MPLTSLLDNAVNVLLACTTLLVVVAAVVVVVVASGRGGAETSARSGEPERARIGPTAFRCRGDVCGDVERAFGLAALASAALLVSVAISPRLVFLL